MVSKSKEGENKYNRLKTKDPGNNFNPSRK
jgi:hypothetical protein